MICLFAISIQKCTNCQLYVTPHRLFRLSTSMRESMAYVVLLEGPRGEGGARPFAQVLLDGQGLCGFKSCICLYVNFHICCFFDRKNSRFLCNSNSFWGLHVKEVILFFLFLLQLRFNILESRSLVEGEYS